MAPRPDITCVIVAYGAEPWLERVVAAALASREVAVEVVLVDNGCTDGAVDRIDGTAGVTVLRPGANVGFAGGCNAGVAAARAELVALVNPDALVEPDAIARLVEVARRPDVGIATALLCLADRPDIVNSAGNELHFLGVSWAGGYGEPAQAHQTERPRAAASGAAMVIRHDLWDRLGGFEERLFAYYEDTDLSLRAWQIGLPIVYVPDARVLHRYAFSKNATKLYLAERNRLVMVLTCYDRRTLTVLAPLLIAFEVAGLALAVAGGFGGSKVRAWGWLARNAGYLRARRRAVQDARTVADRELGLPFARRLDPGNYPLPRPLLALNSLLDAYWRLVR